MKRNILWALCTTGLVLSAILLLSSGDASSADQVSEDDKVEKFMRAKLASSQSVLEGLVTEDYDKIRDGAQRMAVMSKATEWHVIQGPAYAQYSAEFRRAAMQLVKMAKEKNTDGAALSYVHLTMTCIGCHKFVRNSKIASNDVLPKEIDRGLTADIKGLAVRRESRGLLPHGVPLR